MPTDHTQTAEHKIHVAAAEISQCIGATLITMAPRLAGRFALTDQQIAVAMVIASMQLLAGGAAAIIIGHPASDETYEATTSALTQRIQLVIGEALEVSG